MINTQENVISNNSSKELADYLQIGFVQTIIDGEIAWDPNSGQINMSPLMEEKAWKEIKEGLAELKAEDERPKIIVLPELAVPNTYLNSLKSLTQEIGTVIIAGLDFNLVTINQVENKAVVLVPKNWPDNSFPSKDVSTYYFGKIYFSEDEKKFFSNTQIAKIPYPHPNTYIFDAGIFGRLGVAICSDFFDLERFIIYRGRVHHLIVIAHNKDTNSFYYLAEALSRILYCNVVICNTGFYGDSLAFAPYNKNYNRIVYRHEGQKLFSTQVVKLPVKSLDEAQSGNNKGDLFKGCPPGYHKY